MKRAQLSDFHAGIFRAGVIPSELKEVGGWTEREERGEHDMGILNLGARWMSDIWQREKLERDGSPLYQCPTDLTSRENTERWMEQENRVGECK